MYRLKTAIYAAILAIASVSLLPTAVCAQEYSNPVVKVSQEKVRSGGKLYYSHIVEERQTLFSISKAYGVSLEEIYSANSGLNLEKEGLKKGQILLIPFKDGKVSPTEAQGQEEGKGKEEDAGVSKAKQKADEGYIFHKVKWYEDLESISSKYNVSKRSIMNINNLSSEKLQRKQMLKIPKDSQAWEYRLPSTGSDTALESGKGIAEAEKEDDGKTAEDAVSEKDKEKDPVTLFPSRQSNDVNIALALPFNVRKGGNSQMMDFYSGALMAARDLGKKGYRINLDVVDVVSEAMPDNLFEKSDYIIGPVSNADIMKAVSKCKSRT